MKPRPAVGGRTVVMVKPKISGSFCAIGCTNSSQTNENLRFHSNSVVDIRQTNLASIVNHIVIRLRKAYVFNMVKPGDCVRA